MNIYTILFIVFFNTAQSKKNYPIPTWITICKSSIKNESNVTSWYKNKSIKLSCFLKENLDVLYL